MSTRAKFKVLSITRQQHQIANAEGQWVPTEVQTIKLQAVTGNAHGRDENSQFWRATPSGSIELGCVNAEAVKEFELGAEIYVDFTPA